MNGQIQIQIVNNLAPVFFPNQLKVNSYGPSAALLTTIANLYLSETLTNRKPVISLIGLPI